MRSDWGSSISWRMRMDSEALDSVDPSELTARLPDDPVASIRDVQALYGTLYTLGRGLTGEYGPYLSPDAAGDLLGDDRLVISTVVVEDGGLSVPDDPVTIRTYANELAGPVSGIHPDVSRVAHSKYESARGVDHSLTHISGQTNAPDKHADHAVERFTRWPTEDAVAATAEDHDDGWLLDGLAELGESETAMGRVREGAKALTEEGQFLHTVAFRFDGETPATTDRFDPDAEWHLPGEIEVLQAAMVRRKTTKLHTKNDADDARGQGVSYVGDGTEEEVYGVVDDPLKWYLSKQRERFPRLDPDQAWRTQGLNREAAIAAQNATPFLDACAESGPGVSAYYFPYPDGIPTHQDEGLDLLYGLLADRVDEDTERNPAAEIYYQGENHPLVDPTDFRFCFMLVYKYQKDRWRLLAFEPSATVHAGINLASAHQNVLNSDVFAGKGLLPTPDGFDLLDAGRDTRSLVDAVTRVGYFAQTCAAPGDDDDPSSDDVRFAATEAVLRGESINADRLLDAYVERLIERFDPDDDDYPFPTAVLSMQNAQLSALADAGLLDADGPTDYTIDTTMTTDTDDGEQNRAERLAAFIESHDALAGEERQGIFALGALVGRISRYQRSEERSATTVTRHPIDKVTKHSVTDIATDVVDSNVIYSSEEGYKGTMYAELMDEVVDGLLSGDPEDWSLSTSDMRYHYAMGIAYGLNDRSTSGYTDE